MQKLKIFVDYREDSNIYNMLSDDDFDIEITTLQTGDYLCNNCLIERKSLKDLIESTLDGRIFKQAQDMIHNKNVKPYILITSSFRAFEYAGYSIPHIISIITSLNVRGVTTFLTENENNFILIMKTLFKKHSDNKIRIVNPIRKPASVDDKTLYNYSCLPGIELILAERLKKVFTSPKSLYNASEEQLMEIEGIGKKKAKQLYKFFNGE